MKSIRSKLVICICALFLFIGLLIYLPLSHILPRIITSQILKRDIEIASFLSHEAKENLLLSDKVGLSILLHDNLDKLEDARYLFIQNGDGSIIAHTFTKGFPRGLLTFQVDDQSSYGVNEFLSNGRRIYDIAFPILGGDLGELHLGVSLESGKKDIAEITKINQYVALIILLGLGIGIALFLTIGFIFSEQIIRLKDFASKIGHGDLEAKIDVKSEDEIGALTVALNEMVLRLKEKIQEIKRLNTIEERNRIALDLHDGCAQDAASIIKRIELCEKLFEINPRKALEEFKGLKEDAQDILNKTRKVIFDLKSSQDINYNLFNKLSNSLIDYKRQTRINVALDVSGSANNIPVEKSKSIFYIVTEALNNIAKHSQAKEVKLSLAINNDDVLNINIADDGKGFDVDDAELVVNTQEKWGLANMRQRADSLGASFMIDSAPGQGTKISITIPLSQTVA